MAEVFSNAKTIMLNHDSALGKLSRGLGEKLSQVMAKSTEAERFVECLHTTEISISFILKVISLQAKFTSEHLGILQ